MTDKKLHEDDSIYELPMADQVKRLDMEFDPEEGLMAAAKLVSVTLLGGARYRIMLKLGIEGEPDMIVGVIMDAETNSIRPEGSFREMFDFYVSRVDPIRMTRSEQRQWFACYVVDAWIERQMDADGLGMTFVRA